MKKWLHLLWHETYSRAIWKTQCSSTLSVFTRCLCLAGISKSQEKLICFYIWKYSNKIHTIKSVKRPGSKFIDGEITAAAFHLRYIFTTDIPLLPRELLFSRYSSDCALLRLKFHNNVTWSTVKIYSFKHFVRWSKG